MFRWFIFLFCSLALTACSAQTVSPAVTKIAITPSAASTSLPPSPEPTAAAAVPVTLDELGFTDSNVMSAFSGAEKTITREADGSYSVPAISYNQETKVTADYKIDKTTFSLNPEIKNAYAPATVNAVDSQGNKVTLIWDAEHGAWRVPFPMVDNSDFSKIDQIPFVPEGDQKIAVESALLYFKDYPPFTDAAVESYKKYGGNSLGFVYDKDGKWAFLKAKGNDHKNVTPDNAAMKVTPFWVYQKINGVRQNEPLVVVLDPSDPKNPQANEYKIISTIDGYFNRDITKLSEFDKKSMISAYYGQAGFALPYLVLYGDAQYQKTHPLLASLLALPGNVFGQLPNPDTPGWNFQNWIDQDMRIITAKNPLAEAYDPNSKTNFLPPEIQTMRLLFQLGVSQ